jgi:hypothetical protein
MELINKQKIEQLVQSLYLIVMNRAPDPGGARYYEDLIERIGVDRAIPEMLRAFLSSPEYSGRLDYRGLHVSPTLASYGTRLINGLPVNHVVSLGTHCQASSVLKNGGLKKYSLPFDWLLSTPEIVLDCLADDFANLLNQRYYQSIAFPNESRADHTLYRDRYGLEAIFTHRDPSKEEHYAYLNRCVERFRRLLQSPDPKLFLMTSRSNVDLPGAFPKLVDALLRVCSNFSLMGIHVLTPTGKPGIISMTPIIEGDHNLYAMHPSSREDAFAQFEDKLDEWTILRLIHCYKIALKDFA